jgi:hypothetical protein
LAAIALSGAAKLLISIAAGVLATDRHVNDQILNSSFSNSLQVFTHRLEMNAGYETCLRFEHVPGLLNEHREPLPGLLGLQMKTTQYGRMLGVIRRDWGHRVCHRGLPLSF